MIIYSVTAKVFAKDAGSLMWGGTLGEIAAASIEEAIGKAKQKLVASNATRGPQGAPIVRVTKIEEVREEIEVPVIEPPQPQVSSVVLAPSQPQAGPVVSSPSQPQVEPVGSVPFPRPLSSTGRPISDQDWAIVLRHLQHEVLPLLEKNGVKITSVDPTHFFSYLICEHNGKPFTLSANPNVPALTASLNFLPAIQQRVDRLVLGKTKTVYSSDVFRMSQIIGGGKSQAAVTDLIAQVLKSKGISVLPD